MQSIKTIKEVFSTLECGANFAMNIREAFEKKKVWIFSTLHTRAAYSLFQPIYQLLIQCLYPPGTMWDSSYILA